jgi:hypothetical protein
VLCCVVSLSSLSSLPSPPFSFFLTGVIVVVSARWCNPNTVSFLFCCRVVVLSFCGVLCPVVVECILCF